MAGSRRYAAMRQFGNATRIKEQTHETVGFRGEQIGATAGMPCGSWLARQGSHFPQSSRLPLASAPPPQFLPWCKLPCSAPCLIRKLIASSASPMCVSMDAPPAAWSACRDSSTSPRAAVPSMRLDIQRLRAVLRRVSAAGTCRSSRRGKGADRVGVEHEHAVIVDRRHLSVRIDFEEFRLELIALAGVDRDQFVRQAELFRQRDLVGVRRAIEIKFQHRGLPGIWRQHSQAHTGRRAAGALSRVVCRPAQPKTS